MAHRLQLCDTTPLHAVYCRQASVHAMLVQVLRCVVACLAGTHGACMRCTPLHFSTQKLPPEKFGELDRQLAGQQAGLNALTVEEYLAARARFSPRERDGRVARRARTSWRCKLAASHTAALEEAGCSADEAAARGAALADRQMRSLHALHNPDRVVGGHDVIADFGDGQVNATIGRQWILTRRDQLSRVGHLDAAAASVPAAARSTTFMNGWLLREEPDVSTPS